MARVWPEGGVRELVSEARERGAREARERRGPHRVRIDSRGWGGAQQPRHQHVRPGEHMGFMQPIGGAPAPNWAQAYQMPPAGGATSMYEALGMPAANYSRHPSPFNQSSAYSEVNVQNSMHMLHVRKERSTHILHFRLALVMIA